jgi:hypothetical protein
MKFRVSRRRWLRGLPDDSPVSSCLLATAPGYKGKMCCLGFACRQLGQKAADITNVEYPQDINEEAMTQALIDSGLVEKRTFTGGVTYHGSNLTRAAATINDDPDISDRDRERQLRTLFKAHGHQIVFVP